MCYAFTAIVLGAIGLIVLGPLVVLLTRSLRPQERLQRLKGYWSNVQRTQLELGVASSRTIALALVLIAGAILLFGFAYVWIEIRRPQSPERMSVSTSAIEQLLQKKLLDPEIQQQQHQEIINALRNPEFRIPPERGDAIREELSRLESRIAVLERATKEGFSGTQTAGTIAWLLLGVPIFVGLWLLGRAAFVKSGPGVKLGELLGAAALIALSVFGGSKLKADLKGELSLVKQMGTFFAFNYTSQSSGTPEKSSEPAPSTEPRSVDVYLHLDIERGKDNLPVGLDCGEGDEQRVGPFDHGQTTIPTGGTQVENVVKFLRKRATEKHERITSIILIGSADRRPLKPRTALLYSSNVGLARARVAAVKEKLGEFFEKGKPPILEFYAGPEKTDAKLPITDIASDRSVKVCILWEGKP